MNVELEMEQGSWDVEIQRLRRLVTFNINIIINLKKCTTNKLNVKCVDERISKWLSDLLKMIP